MQEVLGDVETHDDIAFASFREHSVLLLERTSKAVLRSYIFLWGNVFDAKRGGRNKKQLWFKGIGEYRKNKIFQNVQCQSVSSILSRMFSEIRQTLYGIPTGSCLENFEAETTIFVGTDDTKILVSFLKLHLLSNCHLPTEYFAVLRTFCLYKPLQLS